jgi:hypothetical protein
MRSKPAGTDDAKTVMAKMREMPVNDFFAKNGRVREDGRFIHDMYVYEVKKPSESKYPWITNLRRHHSATKPSVRSPKANARS